MKEKIEFVFDDNNIINNNVNKNNINKIKEENKSKININNNYNQLFLNLEKNEEINKNKFYICFNRISLHYCFFILIGIFLIVFILIIFFSIFILFNNIYKTLYKKYFIKEIFEPINNSNSNLSHAFNIRNKALNDIILESRLKNLAIITKFIINNLNINENSIDFSILKNGINYYEQTINEYKDFNYFNDSKNYLFKIDEFIIFDINSHKYLHFSYNLNNKYLKKFLDPNENIQKIVEDIQKNNKNILFNNVLSDNNNFKSDFVDYVFKNEYFNENNLNYIKFYKKNSLLFGLRMGKESLSNLLNYNENETITIIPVTNFTDNKLTLHLFYNSNFFTSFFNYGVKNLLDVNYYINNLINFYDNIEIHNNDLLNFFKIFSSYLSNIDYHYLYNIKWENEYKILGQIIYNIADDKYKNIEIEPFFDNNYKNNCKKKHIIYCKIIEKINLIKHSLNFNKNLLYKNDDESYSKEEEELINDLNSKIELSNEFYNETKFGYSWIILTKSKLNNKDSYITQDTKIFVYNNYINNLYCYNIEIFNSHIYKEIKENYTKKTKKIINIMKYVLIGVCLLVLIGSLILFRIEIDKTIQRIRLINSIKDMLLLKKEEKNVSNEQISNNSIHNSKKSIDEINDKSINYSKKSFASSSLSSSNRSKSFKDNFNTYSNKKNKNKNFLINNINDSNSIRNNISLKIEDETSRLMLSKKKLKYKKKKKINKIEDNKLDKYFNKKNMYDKHFFEDGNRIIVKNIYECLKNYLENIDFNDEIFKKNIKDLRESFNINPLNIKEDCEFAADLYQAISKINLININDLSYNIYYNQFYALNQNFRIFKSILNSSINNFSLPFKNNKFLNLNNLLKIIYFFKKEKIQKLIQIIYHNNLKFKLKTIEEIQKNNLLENKQINDIKMKNINNEEEDEKEI